MRNDITPNGWRGDLSPSGDYIGFGNAGVNVGVKNLRTLIAIPLPGYRPAGWRIRDGQEEIATTGFVPEETSRIFNPDTGVLVDTPPIRESQAPILLTHDGALWGMKAGRFYRNDIEVPIAHTVAGSLDGQVLAESGEYVAAELLHHGYRTAVFDKHGSMVFVAPNQAVWGAVFNFAAQPLLFQTVNGRAVIDGLGGRMEVATTYHEDNRGALVEVDGRELWAATFAFQNGLPYAFLRPYQDVKGIKLQMPGGLMQLRFNAVTRTFTLAAYHQGNGDTVVWTDVSIDLPRTEFHEPATVEPPDPTDPPVDPPTPGEPRRITVRVGEVIEVEAVL